jgi:hypothetical protein
MSKIVSIRQKLDDYKQVYLPLKDFVCEVQGSDICFITTELWRAYLTAMQKLPSLSSEVTLNLPRQHIQLNIGCNFNYNVKRPRRTPQDMITLDKNHFLPEVINDWENLSPKTQDYWRQRLIEKGIIPKPQTNFFRRLWNRVKHLFT